MSHFDEVYKYEIALVGSTKSGKTSLLKQYLYGKSVPDNELEADEKYKTTHARYFEKNVTCNGGFSCLDFLDIGGSQLKNASTSSLMPMYLSGKSAIGIVYDVNDDECFEKIRDYLPDVINSADERALFFLIGTKSDKPTKQNFHTNLAILEALSIEENGPKFFAGSYLVSATKEHASKVDNMFHKMTTLVLEEKRKLVASTIKNDSETRLLLYKLIELTQEKMSTKSKLGRKGKIMEDYKESIPALESSNSSDDIINSLRHFVELTLQQDRNPICFFKINTTTSGKALLDLLNNNKAYKKFKDLILADLAYDGQPYIRYRDLRKFACKFSLFKGKNEENFQVENRNDNYRRLQNSLPAGLRGRLC